MLFLFNFILIIICYYISLIDNPFSMLVHTLFAFISDVSIIIDLIVLSIFYFIFGYLFVPIFVDEKLLS